LHKENRLGDLPFRVQVSYATAEGKAAIPTPAFIRGFKRLGLANVQLIERALLEDEYYRLLQEADVVVIPFRKNEYHARTSGTFTEALAAGKPVVVTRGTWMSDQLERFGAGITFRDGDVDDLARAILDVRDQYPRLAKQALNRRGAWIAYHNPEHFLDELLKLASSRA
jgi:glycosyltransferase involved in cell wall biosynthesis